MRGVRQEYLIMRRDPIKIMIVQKLMGVKTNMKATKMKSIIIPHVQAVMVLIARRMYYNNNPNSIIATHSNLAYEIMNQYK